MEFGLFMNGYLPGPASRNSEAEHTMLMRELEYAIHADGTTGSTPGSASTTPSPSTATCRRPRS